MFWVSDSLVPMTLAHNQALQPTFFTPLELRITLRSIVAQFKRRKTAAELDVIRRGETE